jgi:hypothetical protein
LIARDGLTLLRQELRDNPQMEESIFTAMDLLPVFRSWWEVRHQGGTWPGCHLRTARRIGHCLGLSWRRVHEKERRAVDEERRGRPPFWRKSESDCEWCRGKMW